MYIYIYMYMICVRKKVSCSRSRTEDFPIPPGFPAKTITFSWLPGAIWRFPEKIGVPPNHPI